MDQFVDPKVPLATPAGGQPPPTGWIARGAADFTAAGSYGYAGVNDPTFAGIPLVASSPLECNQKASHMIVDYNKYAKLLFDYQKQYQTDYATYQTRLETECSEWNYSAGGLTTVSQRTTCRIWKNGEPEPPTSVAEYMNNLYDPKEQQYFNAIAEQTVKCTNGKCGPSLDGSATPKVTDMTWTFFASPAGAPFGVQCQVHLRRASTMAANDGAVTGIGDSDGGQRTLATVPYKRGNCAPSKIGLQTPTQCTVLAEDHSSAGIDQTGWTWFNGLPKTKEDAGKIGSAISQDSEVTNVCDRYPYLQECDCLARLQRPSFNEFKTNFAIPDWCWYLPCAHEGYDRVATWEILNGRSNCKSNVCQNINNIVNSSNTNLDAVKNTINCTQQEWDNAASGGGGSGGGSSPADVISGLTDGIQKFASDLDWGAIVGIIIAGVAVLLLLAGAARLWFSASSAAKPAATATATANAPASAAAASPPGISATTQSSAAK